MPLSSRVLLILVVLGLSACQPGQNVSADVKLETDDQKTVYAIGLTLAANLNSFALSENELELLVAGIRDGVNGEPKLKAEEQMMNIQKMARARAQQAAEQEKQAALAFLEKEAAAAGAEKSDSGLIYLETQAGEGDPPAPTSRVKVHYHGTLRDGTVFDSSVERGTPAEFALNGVIPCWTEGLQKMKPGGKARLVCPSDIAYRDRGAPPHIKPGAALAFEVELIEVKN